MTIALTAATGNVGRHLAALLLDAGVPARLLVRDTSDTARTGDLVDTRAVDLDNAASLDSALAGVTRLFLLSPGPDVPAQDAGAIAAARRSGVDHVVLLSSLGIEAGGIGGGRPHAPGEQVLRESGLSHTILRPSEFMTNTLGWLTEINARGTISVPTGTGRVALIDPADIAAVAYAALTGTGHAGRTYRLTGPESLSTADIAERISRVLRKPVTHRNVTVDEFREAGRDNGMPPMMLDTLAEYYPALAAGAMDITTTDVEEVTGRPATTYVDWFAASAAAPARGMP